MPRKWVLALILLNAVLLSLFYNYSHNTLHRNGNWVSRKAELAFPPIGSVAYLTTPVALNRNRLALHAWNGFQQVMLKHAFKPTTVQFELTLEERSQATFLYGPSTERLHGVRLSSHPEIASTHLTVSKSGEFLSQRALPVVLPAGTYPVRAVYAPRAVEMQIAGESFSFPTPGTEPLILGFRGGKGPAFVDNVEVVHSGGVFIDSFFPTSRTILGAGLLFLFLLALHSLSPFDPRLLQIPLLITTLFVSIVYYQIYNGRYAGWQISYFTWRDAHNYPAPQSDEKHFPHKAHLRLAFLGTSQTRGSGATTLQTAIVPQVESLLKSEGFPVKCINLSRAGSHAAALLNQYRKKRESVRPHFAIINLGSNDADHDSGRSLLPSLDALLRINQENGIQTVLFKEANSTLVPHSGLEQMHALLDGIGEKWNVPVFDLHSHLATRSHKGWLWWDFVHLTDFGHATAAQYMANHIAPLLKVRRAPTIARLPAHSSE